MPPQAIKVEGLRDLQRALREIDRELPKELRRANLEAAQLIAEGTRRSFASRPGVAPKVVPSVKALAQQRSASVRIGGARFPFALGSEFGSIRFKQFPAWRGSAAAAGYSLYPTIRSEGPRVIEAYAAAVDRVAAKAFPKGA